MAFTLTKAAVDWYKRELELKDGDYVRLYVRYGGLNGRGNGFSLGISVMPPVNVGETFEADGITFFIERDELWYLQDVHLKVQQNELTSDIEFVYKGA